MNQNTLAWILTISVGFIILISSTILYIYFNKKKNNEFSNTTRNNFLYFLKRYFWLILACFGALCIITGSIQLLR